MSGAGLRSRWPRWPTALAAFGVIIAGVAAAAAKWPHPWLWLVLVLAVAAAVTATAVPTLLQASQRRQEVERTARAGLQGTAGPGGKLPVAATPGLEARVHQTVVPIPYIRRDQEDAIRAHLRGRRPVLLIGSSMVGKTKMAARVIAEEFGSWPVAIPDSKTALADLDAKDVTLQGTVIWLDDLDRLIGADGITDGALRRLAGAGNIIVGTIRALAYEQSQPSDQLRSPEWDVLGVFEHVFISRELTQNEREQLADVVDDPDIRDRIVAIGIGEYVGAARVVAEKLELAADPLGHALVLGAADWRRCGMIRPVPTSMLAALAEPHLDQRHQLRLASQDAFNASLAWASRDINPNVSLLEPAGTDSYVIYDYALDLISSKNPPIPESSWDLAMANADSAELMRIGYTADVTYDRSQTAIKAFRKVADCDPRSDAGVMAAVFLGGLLMQSGNHAGARAAWQQAVDSGHQDDDRSRAVLCGLMLEDSLAKAFWQQIIDSGYPEDAAEAADYLGHQLMEVGDVEGAIAAYQHVLNSGNRHQSLVDGITLANLYAELEDVEGQKAVYLQMIKRDDLRWAVKGPFMVLLQELGNVEEAKAAWQQVIDSERREEVPQAVYDLAELLEKMGDADGAKAAYQQVLDSEDGALAWLAGMRLAKIFRSLGDEKSAESTEQYAQKFRSAFGEYLSSRLGASEAKIARESPSTSNTAAPPPS